MTKSSNQQRISVRYYRLLTTGLSDENISEESSEEVQYEIVSEQLLLLKRPTPSIFVLGILYSGDLIFTMEKKNLENLESGRSNSQNEERKTTSIQAMMHLLKANIGTGVLAIPNAFMNAGLYGGLLTMPLFAIVCTHCMHLLISSNSIVDSQLETGMIDYPELTEMSFRIGPKPFRKFSKTARWMVNLSLSLTQFGFCCVYTLFVAESLLLFIKEVTHNNFIISVRVYLVILLPLFIMISLVRSLRALSLFSAFSNILLCVGFVAIFLELFKHLPNVDSVSKLANISSFPLYMGTAVYAFEGIGVILPLQQDMAEPKKLKGLTGVVNTSMAIVACLNTGIGFFGYLKYGDKIKGSITLNLPSVPIYESMKLVFAVAIFLTYPIQYYVPYNIIWPWAVEKYELEQKYSKTWCLRAIDIATRSMIVAITVGLAAAIPKLELFISLVGAFAASNLALIFPPLIDICTHWSLNNKTQQMSYNKNSTKLKFIIAKDLIIFIIGIIGFTTGTYASIQNIITKYND